MTSNLPRHPASPRQCLQQMSLQRAAKTLAECWAAGIAPGMQFLARPGSSSLSWAGSTRHCASNSRQRTYACRTQAPVSAYTVSQASQSPNGRSSSSHDNKQAGRDATDTIRSLDSILGSTDDTEVEQSRAEKYTSASASSVPAFSGSSAAVGLPSTRPQEEASRDFQGAPRSSRSAIFCRLKAMPDMGQCGPRNLDSSPSGLALCSCLVRYIKPGCYNPVGGAPQQMPSKA